MESLLTKHLWVLNLLILSFMALLSAQVLNNLLAAEIIALPSKPSASKEAGSKSPEAMNVHIQEQTQIVQERNLFNAHPPQESEPEEAEPEGDGEEKGPITDRVPKPGEECEKSKSTLSVDATMMADPSDFSMAVMNTADGVRIRREGQRADEFLVAAIQRSRVVLFKEQRFECVALGEKKGRGRGKALNPNRQGSAARPNKKIGKDTIALRRSVKKVGKNRYEIERDAITQQMESGEVYKARVIPHYQGGKSKGYKIVGVRPNTLYSMIGIRSGDVIKAVGDEEITNPKKALAIFDQMKDSDNITLEVERRGRKVTLEYAIK